MTTLIGTNIDGALILPGQLPWFVNGVLEWRADLPMEVKLTLVPANGRCPDCNGPADPISWHFARELLDEAIQNATYWAGEGDIQVSWEPDDTEPDLVPEPALRFMVKGVADDPQLFVLDGRSLLGFMTQTYLTVSKADETADVDAALSELLGGDQ